MIVKSIAMTSFPNFYEIIQFLYFSHIFYQTNIVKSLLSFFGLRYIQGVSEFSAKIDTTALGHEDKSKMLINICPNSNHFGVIK